MKDRLIELMQEWGSTNTDSFPFESVSDFLLANGVIVPPCRAGDTAYYISRYYTGKFEIYECIVDHLTVYGTNTFVSLNAKGDSGVYFGVNLADKSLFFNLEEAKTELERIELRETFRRSKQWR